MKTRILLVLASLTFSGMVHAARYSTVIHTESAGLDCDARAARVSVLFQSQQAVDRVLRVECINEFQEITLMGLYRVFTFAVDYEAKTPLEISSAIYGTHVMGYQADPYDGLFSNLSSCLASRARESEAFESESGLAAFFMACLPDESSVSKGYYLSIAGLGVASKSLQAYAFYHQSTRDEQLSSTQSAWLEQTLLSRGASVRFNDGKRMFYFANQAITMGVPTFAWFKNSEQCKAQMSDIEKLFSKASGSALVECQENQSSATRLSVLHVGGPLLSTRTLNQKYSDFESCMKFKPVVSAREEREDPKHFLGLICVPNVLSSGDFVHLKLIGY